MLFLGLKSNSNLPILVHTVTAVMVFKKCCHTLAKSIVTRDLFLEKLLLLLEGYEAHDYTA